MKLCPKCKEVKDDKMFGKNDSKRDGLQNVCKECHYEFYSKKWVRNNRHKTRATSRRHWLKKQYGMTQQDVTDMFMSQGGVCEICGVSPHLDNEKYALHIDHCHETGNVRALLCSACNKALGFISDREDLALSMYNYLLTNKHGEQNMARLTKKQDAIKPLVQPVLQLLSPRDAVAVEIALEWVRAKGTIRADVVPGIIAVANAFAEGLGWQKPKKSAKQVAEETIDGVLNPEDE